MTKIKTTYDDIEPAESKLHLLEVVLRMLGFKPDENKMIWTKGGRALELNINQEYVDGGGFDSDGEDFNLRYKWSVSLEDHVEDLFFSGRIGYFKIVTK